MSNQQPHISFPIEETRRFINDANHHVYRARYQDTAYELGQAVKDLKEALSRIEKMQRDYPIAHPSMIDTSRPPDDPALAPSPEDDQ